MGMIEAKKLMQTLCCSEGNCMDCPFRSSKVGEAVCYACMEETDMKYYHKGFKFLNITNQLRFIKEYPNFLRNKLR